LRTIGVYPQISPVVGRMLENSPAEAAGLKSGDVLLSINGKNVVRPQDVMSFPFEAGKTVAMSIKRGDKTIDY
jgi:S1-C subfamily serine protease